MPKPCAHSWRQEHAQQSWKCDKCGARLTAKFMRELSMAQAHEVWTGRVSLNQKPQADATHWVSKDKDGKFRRVAVGEMEDSHIVRWVCHFRSKTHGSHRWVQLSAKDLVLLDHEIASKLITGPRILDEMVKRGLVDEVMHEGGVRAGLVPAPIHVLDLPKVAPQKPPEQLSLGPKKKARAAPAPEPEVIYPPGYRHIELGDD